MSQNSYTRDYLQLVYFVRDTCTHTPTLKTYDNYTPRLFTCLYENKHLSSFRRTRKINFPQYIIQQII